MMNGWLNGFPESWGYPVIYGGFIIENVTKMDDGVPPFLEMPTSLTKNNVWGKPREPWLFLTTSCWRQISVYLWKFKPCMVVSINGGTPIYGGFIRENPTKTPTCFLNPKSLGEKDEGRFLFAGFKWSEKIDWGTWAGKPRRQPGNM